MDCHRRLVLILQALLIFVFLAGDGLVVLGFVLDSSPSSALALLLVSVGVLTACSAAIGCCASNGNRCCLRSFLILSTIAFLLQGMGLLGLFLSSNEVIGRLTSSSEEKEKANDLLEHSKCGVVECVTLMAAMLLHCCCEPALDFEPFEESLSDRKLDLSKVRTSIGKSSFEIDSGVSTKKLRQKMAKKYGHLCHTMDWGQEKKWWQFH